MKEGISVISHPLFPKIIVAYQNSLKKRYSPENLKSYPQFDSVPPETIENLTAFFLSYLYPQFEERIKLDSAFRALAGFVHQPAKLWGLLGNIAASIFRFGKHFPSAIKAGMAAMHSYVTAQKFEEILVRETEAEAKFGDPFCDEKGFIKILARIPQKDADAFRNDIGKLFRIFTDEALVLKIVLILQDVLLKMTTKPGLYTKSDIQGIELGIQILKNGGFIFHHLTKAQMFLIIEAIDTIEKDFFLLAKKSALDSI